MRDKTMRRAGGEREGEKCERGEKKERRKTSMTAKQRK